jgi:hypothetical protein
MDSEGRGQKVAKPDETVKKKDNLTLEVRPFNVDNLHPLSRQIKGGAGERLDRYNVER